MNDDSSACASDVTSDEIFLNTVGEVNEIGIGYMGVDGIVYRGERAHAAA